ncbi:MAG: alanine--tRNA ligase [Gemmatimonadota bacterium]|uniref:alanine--tRNA ligase n=1 Tax=Candidatus Palauibacter scopulicola TaxID=3056741 RepID=UPI002391EBFC|nr:alanine--tRNA ligase [Candidatus Palauibacter scopulicola]MDE2661621.1 alanine--tRNA ligase [Candidatus Palauibacter scopulicola]
MKADELRRSFISYFERQGHEHRPSGPLVPADDPTLMFTNAGMVQFKGIFTGETERPSPPRAVTSQKCLRVSGKHNDLEEVGRTARHHTFFEMLGNFSFGDYFKRDAIDFAWEWVTEDLGLEPGRLWATVHHDDDDAFDLWLKRTSIPESRIRRMGDKDNFWQMGDTGPCGPCSELHYDLRTERDDRITDAQFEAAGEADRIIEFWNLVFMQFDRAPDGTDTPLPAPSIDTGAGLERIAALLQGVGTNYHTDLFLPIIEAAEEGLGIEYSRAPEDWDDGVAFRVLADHARAVAFLLADGVFPSNEKRGYVLRRILRRAVRHYWLLGRRDPLLHDLVGVVADRMSATFPELETRREHLLSTTRAEEELFLSTIEGGMREIDRAMPEGGSGTVEGGVAFKLKDTHGIPEDLTGLIARERGYDVDWKGFDEALEAQRARSRSVVELKGGVTAAVGFGGSLRVTPPGGDAKQEFVGYGSLDIETDCRRWSADGRHAFLLERNPFYLESGGQVSDTGRVIGDGWAVDISAVWGADGRTVVAGSLAEGSLPGADGVVEDTVLARVDPARRETERNHTATHLLHAALRNRLGEHVQQAGSLVAPDRLRFDFSHRGPLTPEERADIEAEVTEAILGNHDVDASERGYDEAIAAGAMALFGEKYGDIVRVIEVPGLSLELCGGTHVRTTGQIGTFRLVSETGVAAGIRRIEALTGQGAYRREVERDRLLAELAARLRCQPGDLAARMDRLLEERDALAEEVRGQRGDAAERQLETLLARAVAAGAEDANGARFVSGRLEVPAGTDLGALGDRLRGGMGSGAAVVHVVFQDEDRHAFISVVSDDLIRLGVKAGDLVRVSSRATGSGGGGGARFAQGGVGDPSRTDDGLGAARAWASERVPALSGG